MNIVIYDGKEYFDYAKYWVKNDLNVFVGGRMTGKTFSLANAGIDTEEYEYMCDYIIRLTNMTKINSWEIY